ncbi:chemotaxis protein CheA [candidate division CSSED10-310 bacterium]|uniref:histidine kinase n=1 Tax=candidate division CSSED10-310 bacterium TaxID=2855610 RepID=A0ABV6YSP5_UNCC1
MDEFKPDPEKAKKDFLGEAEELIDEISLNLAELEESIKSGQPRPDFINAVFRGVHSLKGLSGMLGFSKITELTHDLENLLDELRMGKVSITSTLIDFLYDCVDTVVGLTEEISSEKDLINISPIITKIEEFIAEKTFDDKDSILTQIDLDANIIKVLTEYEEYRLTDNIKRHVNIFSILANFNFDTFDEELTSLNSRIREIGEIITTLPSIEPVGETEIQFNLLIGTTKEMDWLDEELKSYNLTISTIPYKEQAIPLAEKKKESPRARTSTDRPLKDGADVRIRERESVEPEAEIQDKKVSLLGKTVRVNLEKVDNVLHMIGELAISKTFIFRIAHQLRDEFGFYRANELLKSTRNLEKQILRLQSRILEIRMVPLEQLFSRLTRNVKKIAKEMNKKIDIHITGEETELDKMLIEELSDPLLHILRNAIDHGIEAQNAREEAGKSVEGNIWINAYQKGNYVIIEVEDDGKGLNIKSIKKKARNLDLYEDFERMRDEDFYQFIFLPGFSTRDQASEISGRGVGMDIVRKNLSAMNGTIKIETEHGLGTRFIISIPITMAIISALMIQVGQEKYAIPLTSISKSLKVFSKDFRTIENREVLNFQGNPIPILRLKQHFTQIPDPITTNSRPIFAVVVHAAEKVMALIVDRLLGRQDIVIKSLGKRMQNFPGIAGGTEIGEEKAILVLDIVSLFDTLEEASVPEK